MRRSIDGRKRSGVTGVFRLLSAPCANKLKRVHPETLIWAQERGETVRSSSAVWPVVVVVAVLGFAFGGCGTLSSSLLSESSVLASRTPVAAPPVEPAPIAETVETPATPGSVTPEADTTASVAEASEPTISIDYQPITAKNAPTWVVALSGPADAALRGTAEAVPADPDVEEYDPWEKFNEKMFAFNYNLDKYVLKPAAQGYNFVMPDMVRNGTCLKCITCGTTTGCS